MDVKNFENLLQKFIKSCQVYSFYFLGILFSTAAATFRQAVALIFDHVVSAESLPAGRFGSGGYVSRTNSVTSDVNRNIKHLEYEFVFYVCLRFFFGLCLCFNVCQNAVDHALLIQMNMYKQAAGVRSCFWRLVIEEKHPYKTWEAWALLTPGLDNSCCRWICMCQIRKNIHPL